MSVESFRIYCDVVFHQSFSRGAEANQVSQSAATQTVHRLEKDFGVQLIDRTKRPFVVTSEGQLCYDGFREILDIYDSITARIDSLQNRVDGLIRVAAIYSVGLHDMSQSMREFMKAYPQANVRLEFLHPHRVYQAVHHSEVDFGIVSYPVATNDIDVIPIRNEEMVLVVPIDHPLASKKRIAIKELEGVEYVAFNHGLMIRKETDRCMKEQGISVNIVMEFDNIETIKQAIEVGLGVSILPAPTVVAELNLGKIATIGIHSPHLTRPIGIIHKHRKTFTSTMTRFIEMITGRNSDS